MADEMMEKRGVVAEGVTPRIEEKSSALDNCLQKRAEDRLIARRPCCKGRPICDRNKPD